MSLLSLKNISFSYDKTPVLKDISYEFEKGKKIFRVLADQGKCVILVSHSPEVATMCDERYELVKISGKNKRK